MRETDGHRDVTHDVVFDGYKTEDDNKSENVIRLLDGEDKSLVAESVKELEAGLNSLVNRYRAFNNPCMIGRPYY